MSSGSAKACEFEAKVGQQKACQSWILLYKRNNIDKQTVLHGLNLNGKQTSN